MTDVRHVLVTGAAGGIGSAVTRYFRELGIAVTGLSNVERDDLEVERFALGDAADDELVAQLLRDHPGLPAVDAVVHMAALPHRDTDTPLAVYRTNVVTTFNVLTKAAEAGIERAVIASSVNASGLPLNNHDVRPAYYPIDVHLPADVADWYSLSKVSDELTAAMVSRRWGTTVVALRFPFTKAADQIEAYSRIVTEDPELGVSDGWAYIHPRDAARASLASLAADISGLHVLHVAARDTTVPYLTSDLLDRYAPGVPRRRAFAGRETALDLTDARRVLGFEAEYALDLEPRPLPAQELAKK
jgi:nucleoside-diphosphate-sugar epimerase